MQVVRAVDTMQGKHMLLQLDHGEQRAGREGTLCVVLRVEVRALYTVLTVAYRALYFDQHTSLCAMF
jgi:hypothetical protein